MSERKSKMGKYNDGTLIMPNNYTILNNEEMTYTDGGLSFQPKWWGYYLYLTNNETKLVCTGWKGIAKLPIPSYAKAALKGLSYLFKKKNKSRGIKIRMTGLYTNAVITGCWSR